MNYGFFSFPSSQSNEIIDIKEFDTSSVYNIPPNAKTLILFAVGGGGGGAGGWRSATNGSGGGSGGMGSNVVLTEISTKMFSGVKILNIIIGAGGTGGAGSASDGGVANNGGAGAATQIWIPGRKSYLISAAGSQYGLAPGNPGSAGSQAASGSSVGMSLLFGIPVYFSSTPYVASSGPVAVSSAIAGVNSRGGTGGWNSEGGSVVINCPWSCGGAGGGSVNSSTGVATVGGNIRILNPTSDFPNVANVHREVVSFNIDTKYAQGDIVYAGGAINTATAPTDAFEMMCSECMFSAGFGGAGGGGGASTSANNGARGYRGGGGGGGGGSKGVTAGNGGAGGNGYVKIVATG